MILSYKTASGVIFALGYARPMISDFGRPLGERVRQWVRGHNVSEITDPSIADAVDAILESLINGEPIEVTEDGLPNQPHPRGVVPTIIQILSSASSDEPITTDEIVAKIDQLFPDRPPQTNRVLVLSNVPIRLRRRGLPICSDRDGFWLAPEWRMAWANHKTRTS